MGQYFTVLTGPIFYGINQSMRLYLVLRVPADIGAALFFADSRSDYPFKQSNIFFEKSQ